MPAAAPAVSDMLVTVKSREVQRGLLAEMRGDRAAAARHLLAGAHLELVLAGDYEAGGEPELALRSRLSAASCFWRAGSRDLATSLFDDLTAANPASGPLIQETRAELARDYPTP
jgi:hypothetical protein